MTTQLIRARNGEITPEMQFVAQREQLAPEKVREELAAGRMVIPANKVHLAARLEPMCIGIAAKCKINVILTSKVLRNGNLFAEKTEDRAVPPVAMPMP